jgi:hypothetical protein
MQKEIFLWEICFFVLNNPMRFLLLFFSLCVVMISSCSTKKEIKVLYWKDTEIRLVEENSGATSCYLWKIKIKKKGLLSQEHLLFRSYCNPYLTDIDIQSDSLIILCLGDRNQKETVSINLNDMPEFIKNPIKYYNAELNNTNGKYKEPAFIKRSREEAHEM